MSTLAPLAARIDTTPRYCTRPGDPVRDRDAVLAIWGDNFGPLAMQPHKYDHFYRDNPFGPAMLQLLCRQSDGEPVGVIGAGPRPMIWRGQPIRAAVVAHFAVLAQHRSLGPALMLQQALVATARERFDLLYGLPRPSAAGVARRAGFAALGKLTRHARVLRHGGYLQRRLPAAVARPAGALVDMAAQLRDRVADGVRPRLHWSWSARSDPRMDALWHGSAHAGALTSVRTHRLLQWRFDRPPAGRARFLLVADDAGRLVAWFACDAHVGPDDPLRVVDYWSAGAMTGIDRPLIRVLVAAARAQGRSAIHLLVTTSEAAMASWRAEGFVARSAQPLIGLWLNRCLAPDGAADLHMSWLDQDG
ncbi:hypothetical protein LY625_08730 [Lysobacter sp. GX 14042]|uniref:hypothetical protein n=1 Tax=Lysobacter sp. GX 14042 TaxID=2907155 RepID=UPI001F398CCD|nr:hypothetical protein [Lysobacter sp. GX 14042]MCE7032695.1 hypothetical protein [Lysobacter sp. GX 14042]